MARKGRRRAEQAGLVYVDYHGPGISRRRCGRGFSFFDPDGNIIRGSDRQRLVTLAVPPIWDRVWMSINPDGHLLATGIDPAGRRQYRYHPRWSEVAAQTKYHGLALFGHRLPRLRRRVRRDLNDRRLSHRRVTAGVVRLLDRGHLRIGSRRYFDSRGTAGATTLTADDVRMEEDHIELDFVGKSGRQRHVEIRDSKLADLLTECSELDGQFLFHYIDRHGEGVPIRSNDVNRYLRRHMGRAVTAKDFRTWTGCVTAWEWLNGAGRRERAGRAKAASMIRVVSERLGNTPSVCRAAYIDPRLTAMADGSEPCIHASADECRRSELSVAESSFMAWLTRAGASLKIAA